MPFHEPILPKPPAPTVTLTPSTAPAWFKNLYGNSPYLDRIRFIPGGPTLLYLKAPVWVDSLPVAAALITRGSVWWYDTISEAEAAYQHDVDLMDGLEGP
jgi:hypothetical protein